MVEIKFCVGLHYMHAVDLRYSFPRNFQTMGLLIFMLAAEVSINMIMQHKVI